MIKAAVIGGSGYIGGELLRLLWMHPEVEIVMVTSRKYAGKKVEVVHPNLRDTGLRFTGSYNEIDADVIFLSVPHGESMNIVSQYIESSKIIDLSADFRVSRELYEEYYGKHKHPELIDKFVYGLPEIHREEIKRAEYVANPGCNATAVIFALYPFKDFIKEAVADVKVASSGSGRRENILGMHPERAHLVRVYKAYHHRHEAEVLQETGIHCPFTLHSVDMVRGLFATVYFKIKSDNKSILRRLLKQYGNEKFVKVIVAREGPLRQPNSKYVIGSNYVYLWSAYDEVNERAIIFSSIDNLIKGGAGQAVQNMNLMFGLPEDMGLNYISIYPV